MEISQITIISLDIRIIIFILSASMFFPTLLFYSFRVKLLLFKIINSDHKQAILKHSAIGCFLQLLRAVLAALVFRVIDGLTNHLYTHHSACCIECC